MITGLRIKKIFTLFGDLVIFFFSFFVTIYFFNDFDKIPLLSSLITFSIVFILWLIIYYVTELYELGNFRKKFFLVKKFIIAFLICLLFGVSILYFTESILKFDDAKILISIILISLVSTYVWRKFIIYFLSIPIMKRKVLLIGHSKIAEKLVSRIKPNPQLGYQIMFWKSETEAIERNVLDKIDLIVLPQSLKQNLDNKSRVKEFLLLKKDIVSLSDLYEWVLNEVPLSEVDDVELLKDVKKFDNFYYKIDKIIEWIAGLLFSLILLPIILICAIAIFVVDGNPVFYVQKRVGKNEKIFDLFKFRTMKTDAEINGPQWSGEDDERSTKLGKFLRKTHLDELPQLLNVLLGNLVIVGPRPERPEFVEMLKKEIPYYRFRHFVKPGITGWAQVNYKYGASVEESYRKLQFDLYYLKYKCFTLDSLIILKTIKKFFT